jgi:hypothetical protein
MEQTIEDIHLDYLPRLPKNKQIGIGCIGSGFIMADCHLVAYRQAGFNPVAIASRTLESSQAVAGRHHISKVYASYQELLNKRRVVHNGLIGRRTLVITALYVCSSVTKSALCFNRPGNYSGPFHPKSELNTE